MQMSKNGKFNSHFGDKKKKTVQKEDFYPNHYNKEVIHDCINEFGSIIRNQYYTKPEKKRITKSIKRLRLLSLMPFSSKHYFRI